MCQVGEDWNFLQRFKEICYSYEPEIHPGATVRLDNRAVLKVFTTGSVTLTGKKRKNLDAINSIYIYSSSTVCRSDQYGSQ